MLLRFLALRSLVPSCRLGSSSSFEACGGCRGRRGFGWWVDTLDRRGGLVGVSAFAAPRRVIEIQGFDVELLERVEVHRCVEWVRGYEIDIPLKHVAYTVSSVSLFI